MADAKRLIEEKKAQLGININVQSVSYLDESGVFDLKV